MEWTGRIDGDGPRHARWHQLVTSGATSGPHVSMLGFASDEGVRRNQGREGAAEGPLALRGALANLAMHGPAGDGTVRLADGGDLAVEGRDLERVQAEMGHRIAGSLGADGNLLTVVLGGGHETAYASYLGLTEALEPGTTWGVVNLDAHFDLRDDPEPSSGTPFQQMALAEQAAGREFRYAVAGISEFSNTTALFDRADELGVPHLLDLVCTPQRVVDFVEGFAAGLDVLYLTVDLDVLPATIAPGVSAPAALGVDPRAIVAAVAAAGQTGKLRLLDVVELNPRFDVDGRTARIGGRLIAEAVEAVAQRRLA